MGLCLSCLEMKQSTEDDEHTSLLSDDKAKVVESELLTELRNRQLNAILNSTNDYMIDISTIKMLSTHSGENVHDNSDTQIDEDQDHEQDIFKVIPIPQSVITEEMEKQYKEFTSKFGENAVRKYLSIIDPNPDMKKFSVELK